MRSPNRDNRPEPSPVSAFVGDRGLVLVRDLAHARVYYRPCETSVYFTFDRARFSVGTVLHSN